jgi:2-polyprenyl-6-methoxyphenol hydroxylase-like FAD-dependent oxidoreductase
VFGVLPLASGQVYCYASAPAPAGVRHDDEAAELKQRFGRWHDPIPGLIGAISPDRVLHDDVYWMAESLPAYHRGRVAILGDAAHAMTPHLGQGACQAIEDADALARALAGCPGPQLIGKALAGYQAERAPHAARVQRTARTWGDIWHVSGVGALLRDELFRRRPADDYSYTDWLYGGPPPRAL